MFDPFVLLTCALLALFVVLLIVATALGIACSQIRATKRRIGRLEQETKRIRQIEERRVISRHNGHGPLYQFMTSSK
jgi:signal transduction histidine kinase